MPALSLQVLTACADVAILLFVGYYFLRFRVEEKELQKKEGKVDTEYHQVIDSALAKERKILEDATTQADKIIADAKLTTQTTETSINQALQTMTTTVEKEVNDASHALATTSQQTEQAVSQSLQVMGSSVQKETSLASHNMAINYESYLKQIATQSLTDFQTIIKNLQVDLQKQLKEFHATLLPALEKEVENYKQMRLKQADQTIEHVIRQASQEILNKSISLTDHHNLVIQSLEKAKKEGIFD